MPAPGVCGGGGACSWGCLLPGGGACSRGPAPRGVPGGDPPWMATAAGGMHPTGMHSCLSIIFVPNEYAYMIAISANINFIVHYICLSRTSKKHVL